MIHQLFFFLLLLYLSVYINMLEILKFNDRYETKHCCKCCVFASNILKALPYKCIINTFISHENKTALRYVTVEHFESYMWREFFSVTISKKHSRNWYQKCIMFKCKDSYMCTQRWKTKHIYTLMHISCLSNNANYMY